jgi:septal ring factor EnvC (AmiA/AmiB activator)
VRDPVAAEAGEDGGSEAPPAGDAMLTEAGPTGAGERTETLYLEVRDAGGPVDPGTWFRLD